MRKAKKRLLSYFLVLLMMCIAFAFEPIPAKAATTHTATDTESFLQALEDAQDGDVINIGSDLNYANIILEEPIEITKDLTINFVSGYTDYNAIVDTLPEAVVTITDCDVTIKGNGNFGTAFNEVYAFKLQDVNANASLTIDSTQFVDDGFFIVDDLSNDFTVTLTINNGSYPIPTERTTAFNFSEGTVATDCLVVNGGSFQDDITAYLGDNTTIIDNGEDYQTRYEVRSTIMSNEFASMLTDGKLVVSSVVPNDEEMDGYAYVQGQLCMYETEEKSFYPQYISDGVWDIVAHDNQTGDLLEMHRVEVVFEADIKEDFLNIANDVVDNIPYVEETEEWEDWEGNIQTYTRKYSPFKITDMEIVNMWASGYDVNDLTFHRHTVNYSGELREYLEGKNVDFRATMIGAGVDTDLYLEAGGDAVVVIDDVMYASVPHTVFGVVEHIIYVPADTPATTDALIAAAQKRINDYLGDDSKIVVSYGGLFNTLSNEWYDSDAEYQAEMVESLGLSTTPEHYYIAKSGDMEYKFLIMPTNDVSKMITPTYNTVDMTTNISISSDATEIPLDTNIQAKELTEGDEKYDEVVSTLGVEENVTFDLKLYSMSTDEYVTSLEDNVFKVAIPVPTTLASKELMAYYISDAGEITSYDVEVIDGKAVFETDHFSVYTIAEKVTFICDAYGAAHKLTAVPAKAATVTAEGNTAYWVCDCGKWFADADGKTEITDKTTVVIPKIKDATVDNHDATTEASGTTTEDKKDNSDGSPNTGDTTNVIALFGLLLVSSAVIFMRKKEN